MTSTVKRIETNEKDEIIPTVHNLSKTENRNANNNCEASNESSPKRVEEIDHIKKIGSGGFGSVHLVRRRNRNKLFACKLVKKDSEMNIYETVEDQIPRNWNSPFLNTCLQSLIHNNVKFIILEYAERGDLLDFLNNTRIIDHDVIRFIAASLVLALEYLHDNLLCHRDLKLENVLINSNGYVQISDFGLSGFLKNRDEMMMETVGTRNYMTPESLKGKPYGIWQDFFAFGVLLYVLCTKQFPFTDDSKEAVKPHSNIDEWFHIKDLFVQLCANHPEARIGYRSSREVRQHFFFMDFDFNSLLQGQTRSPLPILPNSSQNHH